MCAEGKAHAGGKENRRRRRQQQREEEKGESVRGEVRVKERKEKRGKSIGGGLEEIGGGWVGAGGLKVCIQAYVSRRSIPTGVFILSLVCVLAALS